MNKLKILQKELDDMILKNIPYSEIVKKSRELDYYITKEMKIMNKKEILKIEC
ncbi:MAG: hypothetical protein PHD15_05815 [Clostridia bacterium]|nr:hypothetical protein [Clostridia bacterium]MDD4387248.1 hypothetical protein [Clostridia bacterium]